MEIIVVGVATRNLIQYYSYFSFYINVHMRCYIKNSKDFLTICIK